MVSNTLTHRLISLVVLTLSFVATAFAQSDDTESPVPQARMRREGGAVAKADTLARDTLGFSIASIDSLENARLDSLENARLDSLDMAADRAIAHADSVSRAMMRPAAVVDIDSTTIGQKIKPERFIPDPKKAMWMAIVLPGGGQIYNRKYWKLPLIYGGFLGCAYALTWNNTMYRDYSQAYIDIMDSDPNTKSYESFIPKSYNIEANMTRLQDLFRRKKDFYRRYRDMSVFCMIGVYALSIVDAYVDAELSSFDISDDLSMKVRPTIIHDRLMTTRTAGLNSQSYGLQCSFSF